jgi:crotonobetainyl-CoA:carnitine CoA-transferase CaiB-like acyl-CoA transferase
MAGPMQGIRVVELGFWVAGPSVSGVLADWGAEVVKIEPRDGDPMRAIFIKGIGMDLPLNPAFEVDNRGKRSISLDLDKPEARAIVLELVDRADVFVTNFRPAALERAGMDPESLMKRNPRLVYTSVTGYGLAGLDRDRPAFDVGAFWSRAGIAAALTPSGTEPPFQRGAMGDHTAGITGAAGVSAALFAREKTGKGQLVSTSLYRVGLFTLGWDVNVRLRLGLPATPTTRMSMPNPMINSYRTKDERWFWLLGLQGDRMWPDLVRAVGTPEWTDDPRYQTLSGRAGDCANVTTKLSGIFATKTLAEWREIFDREGVWWAPVATMDEIVEDPQAEACGAFCEVPQPDGSSIRMVSTPVDFSATQWSPGGPVPEIGQHTEEVLLELGYDWEKIGALKEKGAIP